MSGWDSTVTLWNWSLFWMFISAYLSIWSISMASVQWPGFSIKTLFTNLYYICVLLFQTQRRLVKNKSVWRKKTRLCLICPQEKVLFVWAVVGRCCFVFVIIIIIINGQESVLCLYLGWWQRSPWLPWWCRYPGKRRSHWLTVTHTHTRMTHQATVTSSLKTHSLESERERERDYITAEPESPSDVAMVTLTAATASSRPRDPQLIIRVRTPSRHTLKDKNKYMSLKIKVWKMHLFNEFLSVSVKYTRQWTRLYTHILKINKQQTITNLFLFPLKYKTK